MYNRIQHKLHTHTAIHGLSMERVKWLRERGIHKKIKSDRDVKEAIRSGYLTINGASPNRSLSVCVQKGEWTQGWRLLGSLHYVNVYKDPKSLLWRQEKKKKRGEENVYGFLFFFPFLHPRVIMDFVCTRAAWYPQFFFYYYFPKEKSRRKCPLMLMARSPPRSHHRFTTTFLSGSVYQNPGVCPLAGPSTAFRQSWVVGRSWMYRNPFNINPTASFLFIPF
jgi:hypothetical protein